MDVKSLEGILLNVHATISAMAHDKLWEITEGEAEQLARALAATSQHYNIPPIAAKVTDHVNLAIVLFTVYAPRMATLKMRRGQTADPSPPQPQASQPNGVAGLQMLPHEMVQ